VSKARSRSAQDVEHEESSMTHHVLDVVSEDPEIEHVSDDVPPSSMKEHRREEGEQRRDHASLGKELKGSRRDHGEHIQEFSKRVSKAQLVEESQDVGDDERDRDYRIGARGDCIAKRYQTFRLRSGARFLIKTGNRDSLN